MAIKVDCPECSKKISIDEAFAGGVCRCPFCKALAFVPAGKEKASTPRPDAPRARPEAPEVRRASQAEATAARSHPRSIPTASPARLQGVLTIILLVGLVAMIAVSVMLYMMYSRQTGGETAGGGEAPPGKSSAVPDVGPQVAGMELAAPVVYVIDAGAQSQGELRYAESLVTASIETLASGDRFNVVLATREGPQTLSSDLLPAGSRAASRASYFVSRVAPVGVADLQAALRVALEMEPATVALLAKTLTSSLAEYEAEARASETETLTIVLDGDQFAVEMMQNLARETGGESRAYSATELETMIEAR